MQETTMKSVGDHDHGTQNFPIHRKIATAVTKPKTLVTTISKAQASLKVKANQYGIYENFGAEEVSFIEDKFITMGDFCNEQLKRRRLVKEFGQWCADFDEKSS